VIEMRDKGIALKVIRKTVDEKWGDRGPSTKTPLPPG
jgi:hypothetical protein